MTGTNIRCRAFTCQIKIKAISLLTHATTQSTSYLPLKLSANKKNPGYLLLGYKNLQAILKCEVYIQKHNFGLSVFICAVHH